VSLRWPLAALPLLFLAVTSCGGDKSTAPKPAQITGLWTATKIEHVQIGSSTSVDEIALGGSGSLLLNADASYRYVVAPNGEPPDTLADVWDLSSDGTLTLHLGPYGEMQFDTHLSGNTLTLSGADSDYDFDGDGTREPGKLNCAFIRSNPAS
jgi:hypothetical protein